MNINNLSPFIRVAMHSTLIAPFLIKERIIFDYEIIFVEDGCFCFTINDQNIICKPNDIIFIRPNQPHEFESIDNISISQPHIHFDLVYDDKSEETYVSYKNYGELTEYEKTLIKQDILSQLNIDIPNVFTIDNPMHVKSIMFEIMEYFNSSQTFKQVLCKSKFLELFSYIIMNFSSANTGFFDNRNQLMNAVKNYIDFNYQAYINLDAISKQFNVSKYYLTREYKKVFGQSVIMYYNNIRFEKAKIFLQEYDTPISQISDDLGFSSVYSFSRFFKMHSKSSPLKYRNDSKNK